jgi:hypothetical protein
MKETYTLRGQNGEHKPTEPEPKNGIWAPKSVWSFDMSINRKFYMEQEKIYFWGQKGKNNQSEPKNRNWAKKPVSSSDISIDREFYIDKDGMALMAYFHRFHT